MDPVLLQLLFHGLCQVQLHVLLLLLVILRPTDQTRTTGSAEEKSHLNKSVTVASRVSKDNQSMFADHSFRISVPKTHLLFFMSLNPFCFICILQLFERDFFPSPYKLLLKSLIWPWGCSEFSLFSSLLWCHKGNHSNRVSYRDMNTSGGADSLFTHLRHSFSKHFSRSATYENRYFQTCQKAWPVWSQMKN